MPRVMIGTDLHRTHQAKSCFCHPQDSDVLTQPPSSSSSFHTHASINHNVTYSKNLPIIGNSNNTSTRPTSNPSTGTNSDIKETPKEDEMKRDLIGINSDSSKLSTIFCNAVDRDESPPSESTPCT